jgi:hypothetical protein
VKTFLHLRALFNFHACPAWEGSLSRSRLAVVHHRRNNQKPDDRLAEKLLLRTGSTNDQNGQINLLLVLIIIFVKHAISFLNSIVQLDLPARPQETGRVERRSLLSSRHRLQFPSLAPNWLIATIVITGTFDKDNISLVRPLNDMLGNIQDHGSSGKCTYYAL